MSISSHNDKPCPIAASLGVIGDKWSLLILRNSMMGTKRFDDFQQQLGISRHLLTERLKKLVQNELLIKEPYGSTGKRYSYKLTSKGRSLSPVFMLLAQWGNEWIFAGKNLPMKYIHKTCGQETHISLHCDCCGEAIEENGIKMKLSDEVLTAHEQDNPEELSRLLGFPPPR